MSATVANKNLRGTITYAIYDDDDVLLEAIRFLRKKGVKITEVFCPFPVHGIEKALDMKESRMGIVSFLMGLTGLSLALLMTWYMMIQDWPVNIGGKPNFSFAENIPAFLPVIFECTVLIAAHGMVFVFLMRSWYYPGKKAVNPFPETTSHKFAVQFDTDNDLSFDELCALINETGAEDIKEIYQLKAK